MKSNIRTASLPGVAEKMKSELDRAPTAEFGRAKSQLALMVGRLLSDRTAILGLLIFLFFVLAALLAPWIAPHDPTAINLDAQLSPPTAEFPLGTDDLGRCTLSRLLFGARVSLGMAAFVMIITLAIGVTLGCLAGYYGGMVDTIIMRIVDMINAFPVLVLALAVVGILGPGLRNLLIAMITVWWINYGRMTRGMVLALRQLEYVQAAHSVGANNRQIILRHILPNILPSIIVFMTLDFGGVMLSMSSLSFLGLGAQPPTPEWGAMLSQAKPYITLAPLQMILPGLSIMLVVLALNLLGDGLRDVLDPVLLRSGKKV